MMLRHISACFASSVVKLSKSHLSLAVPKKMPKPSQLIHQGAPLLLILAARKTRQVASLYSPTQALACFRRNLLLPPLLHCPGFQACQSQKLGNHHQNHHHHHHHDNNNNNNCSYYSSFSFPSSFSFFFFFCFFFFIIIFMFIMSVSTWQVTFLSIACLNIIRCQLSPVLQRARGQGHQGIVTSQAPNKCTQRTKGVQV